MSFCNQCGKKLKENITFCSNCGSKAKIKISKDDKSIEKAVKAAKEYQKENETHNCEYCDKEFKTEISCLRHEKECKDKEEVESKDEEESYECKDCGKEFESKIEWSKHSHKESHSETKSKNYIKIDKNKVKHKTKKILIIGIILFAIWLVGGTIKVPYTVSQSYQDQEPYTSTERYTDWVDSKNCDSDRDCKCRHTSWLGFGSCDSCKCTREREVTNYRAVTRQKSETKHQCLWASWSIPLPCVS